MGRFDEDMHINGTLTAEDMIIPDGTVDDDAVASGANIDADKVIHRMKATYSDTSATTAAAQTRALAGMLHDGYLRGFEVGLHTLMSTGGSDDKTVTFDLQNSAGVSYLTAPVTINKTKTAKTLYPATISTTALTDGNILWLVVTVSGSVGTQGLGLFAVVTFDEDPL